MNETVRFKRHLMLSDVGEEGQKRLSAGKVLVAGAGGLGSPILMYLAAAGVGTIGIADFDRVDESNLQRQILYRESDLGRSKAQAAGEHLLEMNSDLKVRIFEEGISKGNAQEILSGFDVIVDATDNFTARYLISDTCMRLGKPDVYGAICEFSGQITVFGAGGPCLRCLSPEPADGRTEVPDAKDFGVLGAVPGLVGCVQAAEALKLILHIGRSLIGRMIFIDVRTMEIEEMDIPINPRCSIHKQEEEICQKG